MANNAVVIGQVMEGAPPQLQMDEGLMVFQKTSQCCRCCCCQPNIDWVLHKYVDNWGTEDQLPVIGNIKETAPFFGRCMSNCWPGFRKTLYEVRAGESDTGPVLWTHEKEWTNSNCPMVFSSDNGPVRCPCCCCLPYLETKNSSGQVIGRAQYICDAWLCVPKYDLTDKNGNRIYRVRPDTCAGGMCVKCKCGGAKGKCCRVPFIIRKPDPPFDPVGDAQICDLWAGYKNECCTNREMYQVKFPTDLTQQDMDSVKKNLVGMTLLIDITVNEQDQ